MIRRAGGFLGNTPDAMLERAKQRAPGMQDHPGVKATPTDLKRKAAILALQQRQRAASDPADKLMAQATLMEAEDSLKYGQAAGALGREHMSLVAKSAGNPHLAGSGHSSVNEPVGQRLAAVVMGNNKAQTGSFTPRGYGRDEDPIDPRLTTQGRAQFDRIGNDRAQKHYGHINGAMAKADGEARQLREQQRMQTEGDAWLLEQKRRAQVAPQPTPALTALAGR